MSKKSNVRLSNSGESTQNCQNTFADLIKLANNPSEVFAKSEIDSAVKEAEKNRPSTLLEVYEADKKTRTNLYLAKQRKYNRVSYKKPQRNFSKEAQDYLVSFNLSHESYDDLKEEVTEVPKKITFVEKSSKINFGHFIVERKN